MPRSLTRARRIAIPAQEGDAFHWCPPRPRARSVGEESRPRRLGAGGLTARLFEARTSGAKTDNSERALLVPASPKNIFEPPVRADGPLRSVGRSEAICAWLRAECGIVTMDGSPTRSPSAACNRWRRRTG